MTFHAMAVPEFYSGKILYPAIAVLLGLSGLFGLAILPRLAPGDRGMVGKPAPAFTLPVAANGEAGARMSTAELKGRPIVLDFWASWCGPCAVEAPVLDRLARRYEKRGLVVLGVNTSDTAEVIKAYASKKGLSYPTVLDGGSVVSDQYGVEKLPSLVVIDKAGNVAAYLVGVVDESSLDEIVAAAL
jgi:cytochrome c biogenesis protein CcmG, thiol:disulfide interchange protein DsbE